MNGFRWRFFVAMALGTLCLVALCTFTAVSLFRQQATLTGVLRENVDSHRAATDLRVCLKMLIALESHRVESVADLHARALTHLAEIRRLADHPTERELSAQLDHGFAEYLVLWRAMPPKTDPAHTERLLAAGQFLETNVLVPCRQLQAFNEGRVSDALEQHERVLSRLAWGMAGIGALGAVAGVVLGYGLARLLSQSIRRLHVQIRDAAGKLDPAGPEIVLTGDVGFGGLHDELEVLSGRIEGVVQLLHDREREVARAEQLAAVGQLAAGVGHEIRNPLTSIKMLVQNGLEDGPSALTTEDLKVIEGEVRRMERSLQTFLDFARPPKPERRPVELRPVLDAVLGLVRGRAERQHVATRLDVTDGPLALTADPGQLQQVFVNLVLNALDAMPGGGRLALSAHRRMGWVEVEVSDTGEGVSREMMPRLFQPFVSSKDTGLGLGLVISRRIVEDHGGTIDAANRPGGGATFFVRLPTSEDQALKASSA
jgi:signal transduction histidine kinase